MFEKVTKEIAVKAVLLGACKLPSVWATVSSFSFSELLWAHSAGIGEKSANELPLWARSGSGSGSGSGQSDRSAGACQTVSGR